MGERRSTKPVSAGEGEGSAEAAAHREAGLAPAAELSWGGGSGTLLYRAVTPEYGLLVALSGDGQTGRARWLMRQTAARLLPEL